MFYSDSKTDGNGARRRLAPIFLNSEPVVLRLISDLDEIDRAVYIIRLKRACLKVRIMRFERRLKTTYIIPKRIVELTLENYRRKQQRLKMAA